jgi:hypothetical protein
MPSSNEGIARRTSEARALLEAVAAAGVPFPDIINPFAHPSTLTQPQADAAYVAHALIRAKYEPNGIAKEGGKRRGRPPGTSSKRSKMLQSAGGSASSSAIKEDVRSRRTSSGSGSRSWRRCDDCGRSHWTDAPCPDGDALYRAPSDGDRSAVESQPATPVGVVEKRWGGATTSSLLEALKASLAEYAPASAPDTAAPDTAAPDTTANAGTPFGKDLVNKAYRIVNSKVG